METIINKDMETIKAPLKKYMIFENSFMVSIDNDPDDPFDILFDQNKLSITQITYTNERMEDGSMQKKNHYFFAVKNHKDTTLEFRWKSGRKSEKYIIKTYFFFFSFLNEIDP